MSLKLGRAAAHVFKNLETQSRSRGKHRIVIGKDTRLSGYMLENALSSGILSTGVDVLFIGPLPTPGVAYATRSLRADLGVMISASHNAFEDNGIKVFSGAGEKFTEVLERQVVQDAEATDACLRLMELAARDHDWAAVRRNAERYLAVNPQRPDTIAKIEFVKGPDQSAPVVMAVTVETR